MGLLDVMRAALPAVAAARGGYSQGKRQREAEERAHEKEERAGARQSRMDQMKARLDESAIDENKAQAEYYRKRPASGASADRGPRTLTTDQGIMQWDAASGTFKPTGFKAKQPRTPASQQPKAVAERAARQDREDRRAALGGVQNQITATRQDIKDVDEDPSITDDRELETRSRGLRTRLDSLTRVGDSLNAVIKSGAPKAAPAAATRDLTPAKSSPPAGEGEYARAAAAFKAATARAKTPEERARLRTTYEAITKKIAAKHSGAK